MKIKNLFLSIALTLPIFGISQTSHALSVRRANYSTCVTIEVEKGTPPDKAEEFCCNNYGGQLFIDVGSDGVELYECVFANEFDDEQVIKHSALPQAIFPQVSIQHFVASPRAIGGMVFSR